MNNDASLPILLALFVFLELAGWALGVELPVLEEETDG